MKIRHQSAPSTKLRSQCLVAFLAVCFGAILSWAAQVPLQPPAAGELDPAFGNQGRVTSDFYGGTDTAFAVACQSDRKIVVGGFAETPGSVWHFALARYNTDGTFDEQFGLHGKVVTSIGVFDRIYSLAIQPDGKIVAVGAAQVQSSPDKYGFVVVRYDRDGGLDRTFGVGGIVITDFGGLQEAANAIAIQPDGGIVVAGYNARFFAFERQFAIARYLPDGRLDPEFGIDGKVITAVGDGPSTINGLAIQPNGRIVAVGSAYHIGDDMALARYKRDGRLDPSFGAGGLIVLDLFKGVDRANAVVIKGDGRITVGGTTARIIGGGNSGPVEQGFVVARFNSDGNRDTSFSAGGRVAIFFAHPVDATSMMVQSDESIVVAGTMSNSTSSDFALARFRSDGSLDANFGIAGAVVTDLSGSNDVLTAIAPQADGGIIAVGSTVVNRGTDFVIARYESGLAIPKITGVSVDGKRLLVSGDRFDQGSVILLNGNVEKTLFESPNALIGVKSGKKVKSGDKIVVRTSIGVESLEFTYP